MEEGRWVNFKNEKWWITSRRQRFPGMKCICTYGLTDTVTTCARPALAQGRQLSIMEDHVGTETYP